MNGESHIKVAVCIYLRVIITGETRLKVAVCIYHRVSFNGERYIKKGSGMYISSCA